MFVVTKNVSKIVLNDILSSSLPPSFLPSSTEFHSVVRGMTLRRLTSFVQSASGRLESEYKVNAKTA